MQHALGDVGYCLAGTGACAVKSTDGFSLTRLRAGEIADLPPIGLASVLNTVCQTLSRSS